jgi:hypothetical protein
MNRTVQRLIWCSLLLVPTSSFGQTIDVVVLNAKNGRGIRDAEVWVQFYEAPTNRVLKRIPYKTGPDGVARIQLVAPLPTQITLSASARSFCEGFETVVTADIANHGAVSRCDSRAGGSTRTPSPGQVIFLMRRPPWWFRLLAPLERG